MHTTDSATRAAFVAGLRALADFLTAHPDLPVPAHGSDVIVNARGTDDEQRAEVQSIATLLDVTTDDEIHFRARRLFGPIEYRAVAIPSAEMASYEALMTYADAVTPDDGTTSDIPDRKEAPPFP